MPEYGVSTRVHYGTNTSIPPNAPTGLIDTEVTANSVRLSFSGSSVPEGGAEVQGYYLYANGVQVLTLEPFNLTPLVTGLNPSTPYTFEVSAFNGPGSESESVKSAPRSVTTASVGTPDPPPNFRFTVRGTVDTATVAWDAPPVPSGGPITNYRVRIIGTGTLLLTTDGSTLSGNLTGLSTGTKLGVRAYNAAGASLNSNIIEFTPAEPPVGGGMPATPAGLVQDTWSIAYLAQNAGTKYTDYTLGKTVMADLGVKNMRGRFIMTNAAINQFIREAAEQHGIKFLARFGDFAELPGGKTPAELIAALVTEFGPNAQNPTRKVSDYIYAIEGLNEPNNNGVPWIQKTLKYTQDTWIAYNATPQVQDIPLMGPAMARVNAGSRNSIEGANTAEQAANLASAAETIHGEVGKGLNPWTTMGVMHIYPKGATPSTDYTFFLNPHLLLYPAPRKFSVTEGGYFTDMLYVGGSNVTPEHVAALYHDRHVMEHVIRNTRWFNQHELWDGNLGPTPDAKKRREESFGLKRADQSLKPGYLTMRRFMGLLKDEDVKKRPKVNFATTPLAGITVSPTPGPAGSTTNLLRGRLVQHSSNKYFYIMWRDKTIEYASTAPYAINPLAPLNVTLSFTSNKTLTAYTPSKQDAPTMATRVSNSITVPLSDALVMVEIV